MPSQSSVVDDARELLQKRLAELDEERKSLERAVASLGGEVTRRSVGRPKGQRPGPSKGAAAPRKQRKRKGGSRADQAVKLVAKSPGRSAAEIAKAMKIKPNYLYRVMGDLEKEKRVRKEGRKYFPVG